MKTKKKNYVDLLLVIKLNVAYEFHITLVCIYLKMHITKFTKLFTVNNNHVTVEILVLFIVDL